MQFYLSRLIDGWVIHNQEGKFISSSGTLTAYKEQAYLSTHLSSAMALYDRVAHPAWSLRPGNWVPYHLPQFNDPNLPDSDLEQFRMFVNMLGDGIFSANAYNGVILSKQDIISQINLISGNREDEPSSTVRLKLDNNSIFKRFIDYMISQTEGEPIEFTPSETGEEFQTIFASVVEIISLDSIVRDGAALIQEAIETFGTQICGPIIGNRECADKFDLLLAVKSSVQYVAKFWS